MHSNHIGLRYELSTALQTRKAARTRLYSLHRAPIRHPQLSDTFTQPPTWC